MVEISYDKVTLREVIEIHKIFEYYQHLLYSLQTWHYHLLMLGFVNTTVQST